MNIGEKLNIHKKFFSKIGANYLILGIMAIVLQIIIVNIISVINPEYLHDINIVTVISSLCNYILPFPIFYWLMKKLDDVEIEKAGISVKTFILYTGITITLMWIGNMAGLIITMLLSGAMQSDIANPVQQLINSADIWINLLVISIFAPICEEILFRKFLIDRTIKYGAKVSIILSAVLFAFFHGNLNQFFYAFLMGGFFAYVYIKTGKLVYPIILHIIINLMGSVVSLFVIESVQRLFSGTVIASDMIIVVGYIIILLAAFLIGIISLLNYKSARLDHIKTEIMLAQPLRTVILNYGMIFFIAFCIFQMAYQMLA
jgi:membrane protease YdiL (CAAX protease family)